MRKQVKVMTAASEPQTQGLAGNGPVVEHAWHTFKACREIVVGEQRLNRTVEDRRSIGLVGYSAWGLVGSLVSSGLWLR